MGTVIEFALRIWETLNLDCSLHDTIFFIIGILNTT